MEHSLNTHIKASHIVLNSNKYGYEWKGLKEFVLGYRNNILEKDILNHSSLQITVYKEPSDCCNFLSCVL